MRVFQIGHPSYRGANRPRYDLSREQAQAELLMRGIREPTLSRMIREACQGSHTVGLTPQGEPIEMITLEKVMNSCEYLGDAVQASFDRDMIELRTTDGNNQVIYLEREVYEQLARFAKECWPDLQPSVNKKDAPFEQMLNALRAVHDTLEPDEAWEGSDLLQQVEMAVVAAERAEESPEPT